MEIPLVEKIQRVFIDEDVLASPLAKRAYTFFDPSIIEVVKERPFPKTLGELSATEFENSKKYLFLTEFKGNFFKRCPGAKPGLSCCNYFVLNLGLQCNMNCSYCYLQNYINSPIMTIYTNIDKAIQELRDMASIHPDKYYRVGTGEVTDSLSLDDFTLFSIELIKFFSEFPKWTLELKSKSCKVDQFINTKHSQNAIVSWSINPHFIIETEEFETASLHDRLSAAQKCIAKGFPIAFHIDPMIWHPEWKLNYSNLVNEITTKFKPTEVRWITVGALRFQPEQRYMMKERFGLGNWVNKSEMFLSEDGKLRYDSGIRSTMYQEIFKLFKDQSPDWKVTLCMETRDSWVSTLANSPRRMPEISSLFDPLPKQIPQLN